jgi:hypothetical protein
MLWLAFLLALHVYTISYVTPSAYYTVRTFCDEIYLPPAHFTLCSSGKQLAWCALPSSHCAAIGHIVCKTQL